MCQNRIRRLHIKLHRDREPTLRNLGCFPSAWFDSKHHSLTSQVRPELSTHKVGKGNVQLHRCSDWWEFHGVDVGTHRVYIAGHAVTAFQRSIRSRPTKKHRRSQKVSVSLSQLDGIGGRGLRSHKIHAPLRWDRLSNSNVCARGFAHKRANLPGRRASTCAAGR
jgi:hypothetical protein